MEKEETIDHVIRATWQAIAKSYNEQALTYNSTMAAAMTLLHIDYENGTPSTALGPSMGMEATSLSRILKRMEVLKGMILLGVRVEQWQAVPFFVIISKNNQWGD